MIRLDGEASLEAALAAYFEGVDRGEAVSEPDLISQYPQCAAELKQFFDDQRRVNARVKQLGGERSDPSSLHIRCPHCRQTNDVAVDSTFTGLKCRGCGSLFNLVDPAATASTGTPNGSRLGRFLLIERVGAGAFGAVWKARDEELDRTVAIKIPRRAGMSSEEQEKFFREARAAAQLRHPHIVSVHEAGRDGDSIYIVSDFVQGVTLADWLTGQQPTGREAAELCAAIADALEHAHERGVVHRDLKPANVMIDLDGSPHLMDFGLARRAVGEVTLTIDGQVLGTPAYMSPEQAEGRAHEADRRSDVYSLGVILFELLTGELPFRGNARMIVHQVIHEEPPSPRKFNASVKRDLETITLKCLEKQPARRYATAADAAADLRRFLRSEPITARPLGATGKTVRWVRRKPAAAAFLLLLVASSAFSTWLAIKATRAERVAEERLANGLLSAGDAALIAGKAEARESYRQAWEIAERLDLSELPATTGLLASYIDQPPPLMGNDGSDSGPGGFEIGGNQRIRTALTPDGKQLLTWSPAAGLQLWDVATGALVRRFRQPSSACTAMAISPSNSEFVTATVDNELQLRSLQSGEVLRRLTGHEAYSVAVAFSPDGRRVASAGADKTARVWDAATGAQSHKFDLPSYGGSVCFTPDGRRILTGSEPDATVVWDLESGNAVQTLHDGTKSAIISLVAFADGRRAASGSLGSRITLWDLESGKELRHFQGHTREISSLDQSHDERQIISCGTDGTIRLWDAESGDELRVWTGHIGELDHCECVPNSSLAIVANTRGNISLRDVALKDDVETLRGHQDRVVSSSVSADGFVILTGSTDGTMRLWDAATGMPLRVIETGPSPIWGVALASDCRIAASSHQDGKLRTWSLATGKKRNEYVGHSNTATGVTFVANDGMLASSSADRTVKIWRVETAELLHTLDSHIYDVRNVVASPDGRKIYSAGFDYKCKVWNASNGALERSLDGHRHRVHSIAFDPTGQVVVTSGWDGACLFWSTTSGKLLHELPCNTDVVSGVAISPDGRLMATGGLDGQVTLWDFRNRRMLRRLAESGEVVTSVAFCDQGRTLISTSRDRTIRLWRINYPQRYREFSHSLKLARANLTRDSMHGEALQTFGQWYALRGVDDWAAEFFEQARAAGADVSSLELGRCYWKQSKFSQAAREFRQAIKDGEAPAEYLQLCLTAVELASPPR